MSSQSSGTEPIQDLCRWPNTLNETDRIGWMPEPNVRGTLGLVWSCLLTLALCVYTVLHLNVRPQNVSPFRYIVKKLQWASIGLFLPELIAYTAWCQWVSAKALQKAVNKHLEIQAEKYDSPPDSWTLTQAFYAEMGGFVFDPHEPGKPAYLPTSHQLVLTGKGVEMLVQLELLPRISKAFIDDKSNANGVGKFLVLMQALWFIVQCIGRLATGLPISLLEVTTLAHVACTIIAYAFWWHKPLDIEDPVILSGDWVRSCCASMWMMSRVEHKLTRFGPILGHPELERLIFYRSSTPETGSRLSNQERGPDETYISDLIEVVSGGVSGEQLVARLRTEAQIPSTEWEPVGISDEPLVDIGQVIDMVDRSQDSEGICKLNPNESLQLSRLLGVGLNPSSAHFAYETITTPGNQGNVMERIMRFVQSAGVDLGISAKSMEITRTTLVRWLLALQFRNQYPDVWHSFESIDSTNGPWAAYSHPLGNFSTSFLRNSLPNFPGRRPFQPLDRSRHFAFALVCPLLCGAIHLSAWNADFPTWIERLLWKISSIAMPLAAMWIIVSIYTTSHRESVYLPMDEKPDTSLWVRVLVLVFLLAQFVLWMLYIIVPVFARGYPLVESFISLRDHPATMHQTPRWSQIFPHIG